MPRTDPSTTLRATRPGYSCAMGGNASVRSAPRSPGHSGRPVWARVLGTMADVVVGLGVAVGLLMALAAVAVLVGADATALGEWAVDTAAALLAPLDPLLARVVTFADPQRAMAATLGAAALVWGGGGWALSALIRPR